MIMIDFRKSEWLCSKDIKKEDYTTARKVNEDDK